MAQVAAANNSGQKDDIQLTDEQFDALRKIVYTQSGIKLADTKKQMLRRRVQRRISTLDLGTGNEYQKLLEEKDSRELTQLINEVTTNLTYFFREIHHFEYLKETVLPEIIAKKSTKRLRIWSSASSTGEEPYTLAIILREMQREFAGWDAKILATDLSFDVLDNCRRGVYDVSQIEEHTSPERMKKWFSGSPSAMEVHPSLRELITFNQLNLMNTWPMKQQFDVIFCRNVMIYFDRPTKQRLVDRLADALMDDGYMFIGHSESLMNISDRFELVNKTTYRKIS